MLLKKAGIKFIAEQCSEYIQKQEAEAVTDTTQIVVAEIPNVDKIDIVIQNVC